MLKKLKLRTKTNEQGTVAGRRSTAASAGFALPAFPVWNQSCARPKKTRHKTPYDGSNEPKAVYGREFHDIGWFGS